MKLSRLTDIGLNHFAHLLEYGRLHPLKEPLERRREAILRDRQCCHLIKGGVEIDDRIHFEAKSELAKYLLPRLKQHPTALDPRTADVGMWSWLALVMFWQLILTPNGGVKIRADEKYILVPNARRFYRHLVAFPVWALEYYGEASQIFLAHDLPKHPDIVETLASREETLNSTGMIECAYALFWDPSKQSLKPNATPNTISEYGVRYFERKLRQYACTFDLRSMSGNEIARLLPELAKHFHARPSRA